MKQQVELQNENNRLTMESLFRVIELLSVQQINNHEINRNKEKFITVKETGKSKKNKLNHRQDYRIPLSNAFQTLLIKECQDKPEPNDEDNSMLPSFDHATSKRRQKRQSTKNYKQLEAYIANNQHEEPLEQNNKCIVPAKRTYAEATKFASKKICVIGDSHLNRIKRNIFQKSVKEGKHTLMFFEVLHVGV